MNARLLKSVFIFAGFAVLTACPGKKSEDKIVPSVGPQGRITAFGSANSYCDINNGTIVCTKIDPATGAVCNSSTKNYNTQDLANFCQQMNLLQNESAQAGACNVSDVVSRILSEHCRGFANPNPNPISPVPGPGFPGQTIYRPITCAITVDESLPFKVYLNFGGTRNPVYTQRLSTMVNKSGSKLKGLIHYNYSYTSHIGEMEFMYQPVKGKIPDTVTITGRVKDKATGRKVKVKHSGFAGGVVKLEANINGTFVTASCSDSRGGHSGAQPLSDLTNLVCTGSSNATGSRYEENIQFIRPISSMVTGEEVVVTEAVRLSVDKATSVLTVRTLVDNMLGPETTSSSSLRADALVEADEGNGRAKMTCSIK